MRSTGMWLMAGLSGIAMCLGSGAGTATADTPLPIAIGYLVTNLPAGSDAFDVVYTDGSQATADSLAGIQSGSISQVQFGPTSVTVLPVGFGGPATVGITQSIVPTGSTLSGFADVPAGATVTMFNMSTSQQMPLSNGNFSMPTGVGLRGAPSSPQSTQTIRCRGSASACTAEVPIAGGVSNRRLVIDLPESNLRVLTVTSAPRASVGTYLLMNGHFTRGGSEYVATLDAIPKRPKGSHLVLRFRARRG